MSTWALTPSEYDATVARIDKLNTRAGKRGFTGRVEITAEYVTSTRRDEATGQDWDEVHVTATITGEAPAYGGWTFLAAVDTLPTGKDGEQGQGYVLRYAPGADPAEADRADLEPGRCQHCGTRKANRIYTYLVRHTETGTTRQVGSTCVQDFTGWAGRPVFLSVGEIDDEIERCTGSGEPAGQTPADIVAVAHAAVREFGWVPGSEYGMTTRQVVHDYFYGQAPRDTELRRTLDPRINAGRDAATEIIDALRAQLAGEPGYEANLLAALAAPYVGAAQLGLVVSAVAAYDRIVARQAREAAAPDRSQVAHQGTVGDKVTVTGTVTRCREVHSDYGTTLLVVIENITTVAKMFTTAAWAWDVEVGDEITITGRVKAHDYYHGTPQTVLTRSKRTEPTAVA